MTGQTEQTKTQYVTLTGLLGWNALYRIDTSFGNPRWQLELYLDKESEQAFVDAGIQLKEIPEVGKNGQPKSLFPDRKGYTFKRKTHERFGKDTPQEQAPAPILDINGEPFTEFLGHGSRLQVTIETYPTTMGIGNRFVSIIVLDYVPIPDREEAPAEPVTEKPKAASPTEASAAPQNAEPVAW